MNIYIDVSGNYTLDANALMQQKDVEEIRLLCDTSAAPVNITLFPISDLGRVVNQKIFIIDDSGNAATNNITVTAGGSDTINAAASATISTNDGRIVLQMFTLGKWGAFLANLTPPASPFLTNFIYVDQVNGDDTTALPYRIDKKFATIAAAEAVGNPGDVIYIYPGLYTEGGLGIDRLAYYFAEGAYMSSPGACFSDAGGAISITISGNGFFRSNGAIPFVFGNASTVNISGQGISGLTQAMDIAGGAQVNVVLTEDIVGRTGNGVVVNDSLTVVYIRCRNITAVSTALATVNLVDTLTVLHVNCNIITTTGNAGDSFGVNMVGGQMTIHCNYVEKVQAAAGVGSCILVHASSPDGSKLIFFGDMKVPAIGKAINLTAGKAEIHGNVSGGGYAVVSGSGTGEIHEIYGNIVSNGDNLACIVQSGGNLYYAGRLVNDSNTAAGHGINKTGGSCELASNAIMITTHINSLCITGTAGQVFLIVPGVSSNNIADVGVVQTGSVVNVNPAYF